MLLSENHYCESLRIERVQNLYEIGVFMTQDKVDMYIATNAKYFPAEKMMLIKEKLVATDESKFIILSSVALQDPTTLLIVSLLIGSLGIDRFMLGDTGMGVLKLLTGGLCGILTIIDWCTIMGRTREKNFEAVMAVL